MAESPLPEFLRICVQKGIVDESTAKRIELYRRSRGLGRYESEFALLCDPPDPSLTFDNLIQTRGNSFALELAQGVTSKSPRDLPYNPLYIYAEIGLGKTHLLSAIANAAGNKKVLLVNTADLEMEYERARREEARAELSQWLTTFEILLIDDIQLCEGCEELQRSLFSVVNHMSKAHRWIVISSDVAPTRLAGVEDRLISRLGGGVIVNLHMGDRLERSGFVKHFIGNRSIPEEVIDFLADNVTDNIRRLKASVAQLLTLAEGSRTGPTIDLARLAVGLPENTHPEEPTAERFIEEFQAEVKSPTPSTPPSDRFKAMLAEADTEEEQALALQIALAERIRQLRNEETDPQALRKLEQAIDFLREGKMEEAIRCINS